MASGRSTDRRDHKLSGNDVQNSKTCVSRNKSFQTTHLYLQQVLRRWTAYLLTIEKKDDSIDVVAGNMERGEVEPALAAGLLHSGSRGVCHHRRLQSFKVSLNRIPRLRGQ